MTCYGVLSKRTAKGFVCSRLATKQKRRKQKIPDNPRLPSPHHKHDFSFSCRSRNLSSCLRRGAKKKGVLKDNRNFVAATTCVAKKTYEAESEWRWKSAARDELSCRALWATQPWRRRWKAMVGLSCKETRPRPVLLDCCKIFNKDCFFKVRLPKVSC